MATTSNTSGGQNPKSHSQDHPAAVQRAHRRETAPAVSERRRSTPPVRAARPARVPRLAPGRTSTTPTTPLAQAGQMGRARCPRARRGQPSGAGQPGLYDPGSGHEVLEPDQPAARAPALRAPRLDRPQPLRAPGQADADSLRASAAPAPQPDREDDQAEPPARRARGEVGAQGPDQAVRSAGRPRREDRLGCAGADQRAKQLPPPAPRRAPGGKSSPASYLRR